MKLWSIPLAILIALIIGFNTPILAFILVVLLSAASVTVLAIVTYSKYIQLDTLQELETLVTNHYDKHYLYTSAVILTGLTLGSYYLTAVLYALASLAIYAIAENDK